MTSSNAPKPTLFAAMNELIALAAAVRRDWAEDQVTAALVDAKTCGMTWAQAIVGMARLIVDLDAKPAELVPSHSVPPRVTSRPAALERHADALDRVREDCALAVAKIRAEESERTP